MMSRQQTDAARASGLISNARSMCDVIETVVFADVGVSIHAVGATVAGVAFLLEEAQSIVDSMSDSIGGDR